MEFQPFEPWRWLEVDSLSPAERGRAGGPDALADPLALADQLERIAKNMNDSRTWALTMLDASAVIRKLYHRNRRLENA